MKKPKFELTLKIVDLNNIPLVCGTSYVKWHLPHSTGAKHRGSTSKSLIRDHKATWDYHKSAPVRLTVDKTSHLLESEIHFEILQEYSEGGRGGRVVLGNVKLNLAEYVQNEMGAPKRGQAEVADDVNDATGGITRRYLMQDSKINSTLKIGIAMSLVEGDSNFIAPPLKSAMVFDGIAGIIANESASQEGDDGSHMPSITSKTRELSELQDMYRRTLAASWACQSGEMPPDKLIEDLFHGGDGGVMKPPPSKVGTRVGGWRSSRSREADREREEGQDESAGNDSDQANHKTSKFLSPDDVNGHHHGHSSNSRHRHNHSTGGEDHNSSVSGRGSISQQLNYSNREKRKDKTPRQEMSEFDVRDDLRSWEIAAR